jgi:methylenetetrahydrofolate reductase (NADPH)
MGACPYPCGMARSLTPLHDTLQTLLASGQRSFSFEFFPPKDDAAEAVLWDAVRRLESLHPTYVSVTYGAGGSTRERTTRIVEQIAEHTTLTPVAHLTCVGSSVAELRRVIADYAAAGIRNVLALRGDPPGGPAAAWERHPEGLNYATDLVQLVRSLGSFCIGVAAFPDVHPASESLEADARVLAMKADAGAQFAVTQFFFRPEPYFRLVERARAHGCEMPIIPGIMPVTNVKQIKRFAELSGAPMPAEVTDRLQAVADDPAAVRAVGVELATELSSTLLEGGAPGLHFYTLNRSTATLEVFDRLGLTLRA